MPVEEARALLGLGPTATAEDIRAAHRRRIADAHPDRGGAPDEAARLNAARDLLLKGVKR
jgi:curved DNA-binding protein CbpA